MQLNERNMMSSLAQRTIRERVGLAVFGTDASAIISTIVAAEKAGAQQVWATQGTLEPDALTIFAATAVLTSKVRMGTAIIPRERAKLPLSIRHIEGWVIQLEKSWQVI
jgi:hypothetical protein